MPFENGKKKLLLLFLKVIVIGNRETVNFFFYITVGWFYK